MSKSKSLCGIVRISVCYNQPWRGFTLQRGHFYGETENGLFFVSGLERNPQGKIKVYLCDTSSGDYVWKAYFIPASHSFAKKLFDAVSVRKEMGIESIEFEPLEKQDGGFHPRLTSERPLPYRHMHIPSAGRPTKMTYLFVNGKSSIIQNYV